MSATQPKQLLEAMLVQISKYVAGRLCAGVTPSAILHELENECDLDRKALITLIGTTRRRFLERLAEKGVSLDDPKVRNQGVPAGFRAYLGIEDENLDTDNVPMARPVQLLERVRDKAIQLDYVDGEVTELETEEKTSWTQRWVSAFCEAGFDGTPLKLMFGKVFSFIVQRAFGLKGVYTETTFTVEDEDELENKYTHCLESESINEGDEITNIHATLGENERVWAIMANRSTGEWNWTYPGHELLYRMGAYKQWRWTLLLWLFIPCLIGVVATNDDVGAGILIGFMLVLQFFAIAKFIQWIRVKLAWRKIKPKLEALGTSIVAHS